MDTTIEKILLHEETEPIETARVNAQQTAAALNRLHELMPIPSEQEARDAVAEKVFTIRQLMTKHHKKFVDVVPDVMALKMPPHIEQIQRAIEGVAARMNRDKRLPGLFPFVMFDGTAWTVDSARLENFCERFRKYAHTERQLEILQFENDLATLINSFSIGKNTRRNNFRENDFIRWDLKSEKWIPNLVTIIRAEEKDDLKY